MSFQEDSRVQAAIALLSSSAFSHKVDEFHNFLQKETGGVTDALRNISYESFQKEFNFPNALAKTIADTLRQDKTKGTSVARERRLKSLNATEMSIDELFEEVVKQPLQKNSRFFRSLKSIVGDKPVMVWINGSVDHAATLVRLRAVENQDKISPIATVGNVTVKALPLGEKPNKTESEHPLFPNTQLYSDGTGEDGLNWGSLPERTQLFLAYLVASKVLTVTADEIDRVAGIYQNANSGTIFSMYQKQMVTFDDLISQKRLHIFAKNEIVRKTMLSRGF